MSEKMFTGGNPDAIVFHWTAGGPTANREDRLHYHYIIEQTGKIVLGINTVADNDDTGDGYYAAHTRNANTRRIGVAAAGMAGSVERPFHPGTSPITHGQYEICCRVIAELCSHYNIPVTPQTVLNHGEVEQILNIPQRGKWDVMVLPWAPALSWEQVGKKFRERVSYYLWEINRHSSSENKDRHAIVNARSGLNMREEPGVGQRIITTLPYMTQVRMLSDIENGWVFVTEADNNSGKDGYVAAKYLDVLDVAHPVG